MALAKCPSCPSTSFSGGVQSVSGLNFKVIFIKCSKCGVVVGTEPFYHTSSLLEKIGKALNINIYN